MTNFDVLKFDMSGETERTFKLAMQFAMSVYDTAVGYRITGQADVKKSELIIYCQAHSDATLFPTDLCVEEVHLIAWKWLKSLKDEHYLPCPRCDGVERGWRIQSEGDGFAIMSISPEWIVYGK